MLLSLKIENYALIRSVQVDFPSGFTAICGETGAGKSILLGALSLVLGQRADTDVLLDKQKKCLVEAVFEMKDSYRPLFEADDLDFERESIFRREILPSGKSRAFINDTPVQLSLMKEIGGRIVDIHSQHSTIKLNDKAFQLSVLDSYVSDKALLADYAKEYGEYSELKKRITEEEKSLAEFEKERSYLEFVYQELENAGLQEGEQEALQEEIELISNSEQIKENLSSSLVLMDNEQYPSVLGNLAEIKHILSKIARTNNKIEALYERVDSALIELNDINNELTSFNDGVVFDADVLERDSERLDLIYRLEKKHALSSVSELLALQSDLSERLNASLDKSSDLEVFKAKVQTMEKELEVKAEKIHELRIEAAKKVEENIKSLLFDMGMQNAVLKIRIQKRNFLNEDSFDDVEFMFNANKTRTEELRALNKTASGGELSRLMLGLKAVMADEYNLPTIIFDEIDSGVSGDIAARLAGIMRDMSKKRQVIVITHLPQTAAGASNQFKVYKQVVDNQTESNIILLSQEERVKEIAGMLSNDKVTEAALANSRELLAWFQRP